MAATVTKIAGPTPVPGKGVEYSFSILMDSSYAVGGEPIDLTAYLSYMYGCTIDGTDAIADLVRNFEMAGPGRAVALTASNVLVTAHHGSGADAVNNPSDAEDLSGVGALIITAWGKDALVSSWP